MIALTTPRPACGAAASVFHEGEGKEPFGVQACKACAMVPRLADRSIEDEVAAIADGGAW
jgi:hypothetical protein